MSDELSRKDLDAAFAKTYTPPGPNPLGGTMSDVPAGASDWFQPDPVARRDFVAPAPSPIQPGETIAGSTGDMVTATPSSSGTGAMVPGAGNR